jgi:hypothetical protein
MTNLLHEYDNFVTFYSKCSNSPRQPECTLQLVCEDHAFFV